MSIPRFSIDYLVHGYDCGYGGPLRVLALANFLQETAGAHAASLEIGMEDLHAGGMTWMLSRTDLRIDRLPREGEKIRVSTWPSGIDRLFALRDLVLAADSGEVLARAVYGYLVVDVAARKPLRPDRALSRLPETDEEHAVSDYSFGVRLPAETLLPSFPVAARPRHIDENGHVNNAYLIDWLLDTPPRERRGSGVLHSFKVDFLAEVLENDLLETAWGPGPGKEGGSVDGRLVAELRRPADGASCARAEMIWN